MAYCYLGLLTLLLLQTRSNASVIPFNGEVNVEEVGVEDLKDLLLTSMQNTVSLNNLVTQLTQKIVNIMLTLGDTTTKMEQMRETLSTEIKGLKKDNENMKESLVGVKNNVTTKIERIDETFSTEIEELNKEITTIKTEQTRTDTDIENVKEGLAGVKNNITKKIEKIDQTLSTEIEELKNEIKIEQTTTDTGIENVKEALTGVKNNVTTLGSGIQELKEELHEIQADREVTIISSEEVAGNPQCAKVCAGTTGRTTTKWTDYSTEGIRTYVNISGCGFVKVPTITTALEGRTSHWTSTGVSSVYGATTNGFEIFVNKVAFAQGGKASSSTYKFNIEWVAVGYTC